MRDRDHSLLYEAYKQVYVEEDNISPEDAVEKHAAGESLMVMNVDGIEFVVAGDDDDGVVDDVDADWGSSSVLYESAEDSPKLDKKIFQPRSDLNGDLNADADCAGVG